MRVPITSSALDTESPSYRKNLSKSGFPDFHQPLGKALERLAADRRSPDAPQLAAAHAPARPNADVAQLSSTARARAAEVSATAGPQRADPQAQVRGILKDLYGFSSIRSLDLSINTSYASSTSYQSREQLSVANGAAGSALSYDSYERFTSEESFALTASGTITLEDGRSFALDLNYQSYRMLDVQSSTSVDARSSQPFELSATGAQSPLQTLRDQLDDLKESTAHLLGSLITTGVSADRLLKPFRDFTNLREQLAQARVAGVLPLANTPPAAAPSATT